MKNMIRAVLAALAAVSLSAIAQNEPLTALPSATTLGGTELVYGVQGGVSKSLTPAQFKAYTIGAGSVSVASGKTFTSSNTLTLTGTDGSTLNIGAGGVLADMVLPRVAASGTANAITATFSPAITLADKTIVAVVAGAANSSTTPTFAPNGLTAHTITKNGNSALVAGDIAAADHVILLEYNLAGTRWELLNPAVSGGGSSSLTSTYVGYGDGSNALTGSSDFTFGSGQLTVGEFGAAGLLRIFGSGSSAAATIEVDHLVGTADWHLAAATGEYFVGRATADALSNKTYNGMTVTANTGTLHVANAKSFDVLHSITLDGTDGTTMTFPGTSATIARTDAANTFTGHQTIEGITSTGATGSGKFVFDGSPTIVTPTIAKIANLTGNGHVSTSGGDGTLGVSATIPAADLSGTVAAARMPALTGDITTSSGAVATTLATVNSNVGSFTNASITVNAKGLITAASNGAGGGAGTVTNTGGNLTANAIVLGAGTVDTKVVAGVATDGTSALNLGVAGSSVGKVVLSNATSGTLTLQPATGALGSSSATFPAAAITVARTDAGQTFTGTQAFGALTATSITDSGLTSGRVPFASTGGLLADDGSLTWNNTNKTLNSPGDGTNPGFQASANTVGSVWALANNTYSGGGADATHGDSYFRVSAPGGSSWFHRWNQWWASTSNLIRPSTTGIISDFGNILINAGSNTNGQGGVDSGNDIVLAAGGTATTNEVMRICGGTTLGCGAAGNVGIGTAAPARKLHVYNNANAGNIAVVENPNAGGSAYAVVWASNGTNVAGMYQLGTGFTPSGLSLADQAQFLAGGAGGMLLATTAAQPIVFSTNGRLASNEAGRFLSGGGFNLGPQDAAAPAAQSITVQSVVTGTSNTAGANWTFNGSKGTGTGAGGSILFKVAPAGSTGSTPNALTTAVTIDSAKTTTFAGPFVSQGYTVATLPAAPGTGARAHVTDQLTACAAVGAAVTGGGSVVCPVFYNGAAWVGG